MLTATTKSLHKFLPQIYAQLSECILICIPQDAGTKSFEDKIEDILSPMLLARKEKNFQKELQRKCLLTSQATLTSNENKNPAEISITGRLSSQISPELTQLGQAVFDAGQDIELNLSETIAISRNGLNAIFTMKSDADRAGKNITISAVHESIQNDLHQAGLAHFFKIFPPILDELQEQT